MHSVQTNAKAPIVLQFDRKKVKGNMYSKAEICFISKGLDGTKLDKKDRHTVVHLG